LGVTSSFSLALGELERGRLALAMTRALGFWEMASDFIICDDGCSEGFIGVQYFGFL
jgi:hypothetical protein